MKYLFVLATLVVLTFFPLAFGGTALKAQPAPAPTVQNLTIPTFTPTGMPVSLRQGMASFEVVNNQLALRYSIRNPNGYQVKEIAVSLVVFNTVTQSRRLYTLGTNNPTSNTITCPLPAGFNFNANMQAGLVLNRVLTESATTNARTQITADSEGQSNISSLTAWEISFVEVSSMFDGNPVQVFPVVGFFIDEAQWCDRWHQLANSYCSGGLKFFKCDALAQRIEFECFAPVVNNNE